MSAFFDHQLRKFNVPGSVTYRPDFPIDVILQSDEDEKKRGYWLERDIDGQIVFVSDQTGEDGVVVSEDEDGIPVIQYEEITQEFSFDGYNTISMRSYS